MIVHMGVVLVAVGFAASHAYQHQTLLTMSVGRPASFEGHTLVFPRDQDGHFGRAQLAHSDYRR